MATQNFTTHILVNQTPREAYNAILNVRGWWTENMEGESTKLHDEFTVRFGEVHVSKQKLAEVIQDEKIVWLVMNSRLNFVDDKQEWDGTKISFEILKRDNKTEIRFTHIGLIPAQECFDACSNAWSEYIHESLYHLISTGKGHPTPLESDSKVKENNPVDAIKQ